MKYTNLNRKGFAVSTILYGLIALIILILMLIFGVIKSNKDANEGLVDNVKSQLDACVNDDASLEDCYLEYTTYEGDNFINVCQQERNSFNSCIGMTSHQ